jgi:hypothetical protein
LVFIKKDDKSECHRYIFADSLTAKDEDYLVRRITFNSPKTIVPLLKKLRCQASFNGLIRNLFDHYARQKILPFKQHLVSLIESDESTSFTLQFNRNQVDIGIG